MNDRAITTIEIDPSGQLFVVLKTEGAQLYEFIYREAHGLNWHKSKCAIVAYEPARWQPDELLQHIATTLRMSFAEALRITASTQWMGVTPGLRHKLEAILSEGQVHAGAA